MEPFSLNCERERWWSTATAAIEQNSKQSDPLAARERCCKRTMLQESDAARERRRKRAMHQLAPTARAERNKHQPNGTQQTHTEQTPTHNKHAHKHIRTIDRVWCWCLVRFSLFTSIFHRSSSFSQSLHPSSRTTSALSRADIHTIRTHRSESLPKEGRM